MVQEEKSIGKQQEIVLTMLTLSRYQVLHKELSN